MSLKTWKQEFYPVTAKNAVRKLKLDAVGLVQHSLLKWSGLKQNALRKHELESRGFWHTIQDSDSYVEMEIDADSCALCVKFLPADAVNGDGCPGCPLFETLGCRCDLPGEPYTLWTNYDDPTPMISALKKALKWAKENS